MIDLLPVAAYECIGRFVGSPDRFSMIATLNKKCYAKTLLTLPKLIVNKTSRTMLSRLTPIDFAQAKTEQVFFSEVVLILPGLEHLRSVQFDSLVIDNELISLLSHFATSYPHVVTSLVFSNLDLPLSVDFKNILLERIYPSRWAAISEAVGKWYTNDLGEISVHARNHIDLYLLVTEFVKQISLFTSLNELRFIDSPYLGCAWKPLMKETDFPETFWTMIFRHLPKSLVSLEVCNSGLSADSLYMIPPLFGYNNYPNLRWLKLPRNCIGSFGLVLLLTCDIDCCRVLSTEGSRLELIDFCDNAIPLEDLGALKCLIDCVPGVRILTGRLADDDTREETADCEMVERTPPFKRKEPEWMIGDENGEDDDDDDSDYSESGSESGSSGSETSDSLDSESCDESTDSGFASEGSDLLKLLDE